jgi:hypothetical protein
MKPDTKRPLVTGPSDEAHGWSRRASHAINASPATAAPESFDDFFPENANLEEPRREHAQRAFRTQGRAT